MTDATDRPLAATRPLAGTGLLVSPFVLGGNVFGWTADRAASFEILDAYVAAGGTMIDTADQYTQWVPGHVGGESETIIGEWLAARGNRDQVLIATKVGKRDAAPGLSAGNILASVEASLHRLGTDRIDLYYAHRDDEEVPIEETLTAFDGLVRAGKVRHIAASNFTAARLSESLDHSADAGVAAYVAVQNHYNLMERTGYEGEFQQVVAERGLASLPFYGLARGFLTGKYRGGAVVDSARAGAAAAYGDARGLRVLDALDEVSHAHGSTVAATALAWLLAQPTITAPIASVRRAEQLDDLAECGRIVLTEDEIALLDTASA